MRASLPRFQKGAFEANLTLVQRVKELADKKGVTAGQLALAWVHAQGEDVFPIPGTKRIKYLEVCCPLTPHATHLCLHDCLTDPENSFALTRPDCPLLHVFFSIHSF